MVGLVSVHLFSIRSCKRSKGGAPTWIKFDPIMTVFGQTNLMVFDTKVRGKCVWSNKFEVVWSVWEPGIVQSSFWIHVSHTNGHSDRRTDKDPTSLRRGRVVHSVIQTRPQMDCQSDKWLERTLYFLSGWSWILVWMMVWVADSTPPLSGWHESKNWIISPLVGAVSVPYNWWMDR